MTVDREAMTRAKIAINDVLNRERELQREWWVARDRSFGNRTPFEVWLDVLSGVAPMMALDNLLALAYG